MNGGHRSGSTGGAGAPAEETRPPANETGPPAKETSWARATLLAVAIVTYFAVITVWLPSAIARCGVLLDGSDTMVDIVISGIWLAGLAVAMWALRQAQRNGWI